GVDVKDHLAILVLTQWRVVFVTQSKVERQVGPNSPLILGKPDVILRFGKPIARDAAVERARGTDITIVLNGSGRIGKETVKVGIGIGRPTQAIGIETQKSNLTTELESVIPTYPAQIVDQAERVRSVGSTAAVGR